MHDRLIRFIKTELPEMKFKPGINLIYAYYDMYTMAIAGEPWVV